jgi:hypothetical protein
MNPIERDGRSLQRLLHRRLSREARAHERLARRCRVLAALGIHEVRRLPRRERADAYRKLLTVLRAHEGCPDALLRELNDLAHSEG